MSDTFTTVRTAGSLLPPDLLARVVAGDPDLGGLTPSDYHLGAGENPREAANRAWSYLTGVWQSYRQVRERLPAGDPALGATRERWLLVLLRELGYGRVPATPAGGLPVGDRAFAVSHRWEQVPVHLLGWGVDLDRRTKGVPGAAERAPHAMVQELLNRADEYLWALLSNGRVLRLLRDSSSLTGQSYVEFDLEAMFDGEVFSDFALMFLLLHQSRVEVRTPDGPASDCWLERWRTVAVQSGTRALGLLRDGVASALEALGTGFLQGADGAELSRALTEGEIRLEDYHRALLRLVYRLLFLFVAEDREALLSPDADPVAADRYARFFSTARLRRLSLRRRGTRHGDLWAGLSVVLDALGREGGRPELGLPGVGGLFDAGPLDGLLAGRVLPNDALLTAVRHLHVVSPKGQQRRTVDYRHLGAEELGSIYESLLELVPRHDALTRTFTLETLAGNDRKTTGSYYTPSSLIDLVLDEALDPVLDDAEKSADPVAALLAMTVCDPACGSGHFLVAAARRIAARLAVARSGEVDPTPVSLREALHDVVARCIYGVDVNPMAAELAKVSLWLEALQPGRPLAFLDAHVKVGNALLGATPALVARGIPDAAFDPIEGDDRGHAGILKKRNRLERDAGQEDLFAPETIDVSNRALRERLGASAPVAQRTLEDLHVAQQRYQAYADSPELRHARRVADTWCAAFVAPKALAFPAVTQSVLDALARGDEDQARQVAEVGALVDSLAEDYRFFHWHLEFPEVFDVPAGGAGTATGWTGGFSVCVGNPPWERVKLQEQEFFASRSPQIAGAANAAARKKLIAALPETDPALHAEWSAARRRSEGASSLLRNSGRYPLCGVGDVNTYSVFAEHFRTVIAPSGRMGIVTPTGLATDATTAAFFADTVRGGRLAAFYDFENEAKIFAGVHNQFRFAVTSMTGGERVPDVRFAFYTRYLADVPHRRYLLAPDEVLLLNPNTGTLPLFRSRVDAEITLGVYRRHPVLWADDGTRGNLWELRFQRMLDMANDSGLFRTDDQLRHNGLQYDGWGWGGEAKLLPLYEAKLLGHFDHRYATYAEATQAQLNKGTLPRLTEQQHDDPDCEPLAHYWVAAAEVGEALAGRWDRGWLLGWRDIARASDARTFVPSVLPRSAVGNKFPVAFPGQPRNAVLLHAVWSSLVFDYVARQKLSGTGMTYFIVKQLAMPAPATFEHSPVWAGKRLDDWLIDRVLELAYTSWRLQPYALDLYDDGPPYRWIPARREQLRAELDGAIFHVYGLERGEVAHVLDSFAVVRKYEERDHGEFRTRRLVLEAYDAIAAAQAAGTAYVSSLDPPPGEGPRHPERKAEP
ncbi:N-6 DNA methylase [Kineococcus sp. NUM-3379]